MPRLFYVVLRVELDKEFLLSPVSTAVTIGERVRLRCEPPHGAPNPVVHWTKDGKNLSVSLDHHDLVLASVQPTDFGAYRCLASNGLQRQSAVAHVTEFHRPKIQIRPSSSRIDIQRGKAVDLQCQVENRNDDDQYQVEWHFGNRNGKSIGRNHRLEIPSGDFNHSGTYFCVVNYNSGRRRHTFAEQVLLAVHERSNERGDEKLFSQSQLTVYAGRSATVECQLPWRVDEPVTWSIANRTDQALPNNNNRYEYLDKNQYRLQIRRVEEFDHDVLFECSYQNKKHLSQGLIRLNVERLEPPPVVTYVPNNQTVPAGVEVLMPCQTKEKSKAQWWFISTSRSYKSIKLESNKKYRIDSNHDLVIRHADK